MPQTPHVERHFTASETVRDIVIGMSYRIRLNPYRSSLTAQWKPTAGWTAAGLPAR
jgi:hypothetical protein